MKLTLASLSFLSLALGDPTVYLIRHGEKPSSGNGLSTQGTQRAQCLRNVFGASSGYNINYILAQNHKSDGSRKRPYDTVHPLAQELGITIDTSCERDDPDCVEDAVKSFKATGNILICWEHDLTLGDDNAPSYSNGRCDIIWQDPPRYHDITDTYSENCQGLDN